MQSEPFKIMPTGRVQASGEEGRGGAIQPRPPSGPAPGAPAPPPALRRRRL